MWLACAGQLTERESRIAPLKSSAHRHVIGPFATVAKCICNTTVTVKRLSITITHLSFPLFLLHQQSINSSSISINRASKTSTDTIPSPRHILLYLLLTLASAAVMTTLFQKLTRPFTSSTLRFAPEQTARMDVPDGAQKCTIAAGCFWGVEHMYRKDFGGKGLLDARVGYIGGDTKSPSYRAVCSGSTGRELH